MTGPNCLGRAASDASGNLLPPSPPAEKATARQDCLGRAAPDASGDLLPPSPPAEKATARQDQAGKASTGDGAGDEACISIRPSARQIGDDCVRTGTRSACFEDVVLHW